MAVTSSLGRYVGLLRQPDFRRLWLAQSVSQVGTQVTQLALPLVAILVLKASPFEVALLGAVEFLPFLLFTLPAGAWVDRLPKKRILVTADLGRAVVLGLVPIAAVFDALAMWELYMLGFAAGVLTVFFEVAYQSLLPELVPRDRLAEGNSRLEISRSAAQLLGPGLGGALIGILGPPIAIAVDALSYVGSAGFLIGLGRSGASPATPAPPRDPTSSVRREIVEGLRFYRRSPLLLAESAAIVTVNFGLTLGGSIFLVYLVRELALTPALIGLAFSFGAVGTLIGAVGGAGLGRRIGVGPSLIVGCTVGSAATFVMVLANPATAFPLLVLSGVLQGLTLMVVNINGVSLRQALTPDALQGRVNATGRWINWSVIPLATIIGGAVATAIGLRATIALSVGISLLSLPWLLLSPLRSLREMPGEAPVTANAHDKLPGGRQA